MDLCLNTSSIRASKFIFFSIISMLPATISFIFSSSSVKFNGKQRLETCVSNAFLKMHRECSCSSQKIKDDHTKLVGRKYYIYIYLYKNIGKFYTLEIDYFLKHALFKIYHLMTYFQYIINIVLAFHE